MERNVLSNFGRHSPKEHTCKIISKLFSDLAEVVISLFLFIAVTAILFNGAEPFEQIW